MPGEKVSDLNLIPDEDINEDLWFYVVSDNLDLVDHNPYVSQKMTLRQLKEWLDSQ